MSETEERDESSQPGDGSTRRQLLVRSLAGAAAVGAAGLGAYAHHKTKGTPHDEMPVEIKDDLRPMDQRDMLWTFSASQKLHDEHPERVEAFNGFNFITLLGIAYGLFARHVPGDI